MRDPDRPVGSDPALRVRRASSEIFLPAALALIGTLTVLYATAPWGIGLSPDSTTYVRVARGLFHKSAFREMAGITDGFPPLYPVVLAAVGKVAVGVVSGARWLNAVLFGADVLMIGVAVRRHTGSLYAGLLGSLLALSAIGLLEIHFMAWSEPLFLLFLILGLVLLAAFLEHAAQSRLLCLSAAAGALAFLDRYPGVTLVIAGTLGILCLSDMPLRKRGLDALVFGLLSGLPTVVWILWTIRATGGVGGRHAFYYHRIGYAALQSGVETVGAWLIPKGLHELIARHPFPVLALGTLTMGIAGVYGRLLRRPVRWRRADPERTELNMLPAVLGFFIVVYASFLMFAFSFIQLPELNARFLSPIYVSGLILIVCLASRVVRSPRATPSLREAVFGLCLVLAVMHVAAAVTWVADARREGLGYAGRTWRESPIIGRVRALPSAITIYTNGPDAIYILTGRIINALPAKVSDSTGLTNKNYAAQINMMRTRIQEKDAVIVYITALSRLEFPSERELQKALPIRLIERVSDGSIYAR